MHRRSLFALPILALARPMDAATWQPDLSELRLAAGPVTVARATARLRVSVTATKLQGPALAQALDAGHIEAAILDAPTLAQARTLMAERLLVLPPTRAGTPVIRQVLSKDLRQLLTDLLTTEA